MATLKKDGIVKITENSVKIARLKSLGYVEIEPVKVAKKDAPAVENPPIEGEDQQDEEPKGTFDIDGLTVKQLKAYAAEHSIDLTGKRTKMEILQAIYGQQGE